MKTIKKLSLVMLVLFVVAGSAVAQTSAVIKGEVSAGVYKNVQVDSSGVLATSISSLALPTGAATSAKQDTGNTSLGTLVTNSPALVGGRVPVTSTPTAGALVDCSSTVTSGGTSQVLVTSNSSRKYFFFQNVSDITLWITEGATAVANQPSIQIAAGAGFVMEGSYVSTGAWAVLGATTGKAFTCKTN